METESKVIFDNEQVLVPLHGKNIAYAERNPLTMRHFNGRLARKSLAFPKKAKPNPRGEEHKWSQQTPAMTTHLTKRAHSVGSFLFAVVLQQRLSGGLPN